MPSAPAKGQLLRFYDKVSGGADFWAPRWVEAHVFGAVPKGGSDKTWRSSSLGKVLPSKSLQYCGNLETFSA